MHQVLRDKKMQIAKSKVTVLTAIICLAGIACIARAIDETYTVHSSGSISYPITQPLHTEGRFIKDDLGNIVFLRGVNKPTFNADPTGWWQPEGGISGSGHNTWNEEAVVYNLNKMKEMGANTVRFHLNLGFWFDPAPHASSGLTNAEMVKRACELASEREMYVILDGFNNGAGGGPGGQSPLPWQPSNPNIADVEGFVNWWKAMSDTYGDLPNVIYDLWNEPHGGTELEWFNACQQVVTALRDKGDDHLVLYQFGYTGRMSNEAVTTGHILTGGNIVYGMHAYRYIGNYQGYWLDEGGVPCYSYDLIEKTMLGGYDPANKADFHIQNLLDAELPFGMFEFGCAISNVVLAPDRANELQWLASLLQFFNNYNGSYTEWQWWDENKNFALLAGTDLAWCPPLNEGGEILRDAILTGEI